MVKLLHFYRKNGDLTYLELRRKSVKILAIQIVVRSRTDEQKTRPTD
jgi:hypothetical protein